MSSSIVFITGSTGFIGSQITAVALQAGYRVKLSIRRAEQEATLRGIFSEFNDKLSFSIVPDFTVPNAFVHAVQGVDYVIHVASPMLGKGVDFRKDYIEPAARGTTSILDASNSSPSIKKVLVMSSILALLPLGALFQKSEQPVHIKENSGIKYEVNPDMEFPVPEHSHGIKYQGSKILAHQATQDWLQQNTPAFSVLTFHPTFVVGPSLLQETPGAIDSINKFFLDTIKTGLVVIPPVLVDVRNVADAFVRALAAPAPSGREFILSGPPIGWGKIADVAESVYPGLVTKPTGPESIGFSVETTGAEELLNVKWKSINDLVRGVIDQQLGLLNKGQL